MESKIFRVCFMLLFFLSFVSGLSAMDTDLWNMPVADSSRIAWQDKPVELNGIQARGTHLYSDLTRDDILDFYKDFLFQNGWELKDDFGAQNIMAFTRGARFMYVAVRDNGKDMPADVYLISSPSDLAICRMIASFMRTSDAVVSQDLPGKDIMDIPRYPNSKRMISIFAPDEGAILLYQAKGNQKDIVRFYQSNLRANGWELPPALGQGFLSRRIPDLSEIGVLVFTKGKESLVININPMIEKDGANNLNIITIAKNMLEELGTPAEEAR